MPSLGWQNLLQLDIAGGAVTGVQTCQPLAPLRGRRAAVEPGTHLFPNCQFRQGLSLCLYSHTTAMHAAADRRPCSLNPFAVRGVIRQGKLGRVPIKSSYSTPFQHCWVRQDQGAACAIAADTVGAVITDLQRIILVCKRKTRTTANG